MPEFWSRFQAAMAATTNANCIAMVSTSRRPEVIAADAKSNNNTSSTDGKMNNDTSHATVKQRPMGYNCNK